jgi:DNA repair exonuclease SbcCD ATPase subunit
METNKKTILNGIGAMLLILIVVIAGIIIMNKKSQIDVLNQQNATLNETIELRDSLVNDMTNTFTQIEENLTFVRNKRDQMVLKPQEGQENQKEMLVADIKLMNEMLEESSKKIEELDKKLKNSGFEIKSFRNKIAQLNKSIEEQDNNIQQLRAEIEQRDYKINELGTQVASLQTDIAVKEDSLMAKSQVIADKSQIIVERENEINKAFVAVGTHDQLIKNGVLSQKNGFLGIGKSLTINDNLNQQYFTQLDIRNTNQFPINSKKVKLISDHPANSYTLVEENDKIAYLEIENPDEFWKLTKYVIVETK